MSEELRALYAKLYPGQLVWTQVGPQAQPQRLGFITTVGWDSVDVIYFPPPPYPPVERVSGAWLINDPRITQPEWSMKLGDRMFVQPAAEWLTPMGVLQRLERLEKAIAELRNQRQDKAS